MDTKFATKQQVDVETAWDLPATVDAQVNEMGWLVHCKRSMENTNDNLVVYF